MKEYERQKTKLDSEMMELAAAETQSKVEVSACLPAHGSPRAIAVWFIAVMAALYVVVMGWWW